MFKYSLRNNKEIMNVKQEDKKKKSEGLSETSPFLCFSLF